MTIGHDTAMNTALEMIDKLVLITKSHDRCKVVEVMWAATPVILL